MCNGMGTDTKDKNMQGGEGIGEESAGMLGDGTDFCPSPIKECH